MTNQSIGVSTSNGRWEFTRLKQHIAEIKGNIERYELASGDKLIICDPDLNFVVAAIKAATEKYLTVTVVKALNKGGDLQAMWESMNPGALLLSSAGISTPSSHKKKNVAVEKNAKNVLDISASTALQGIDFIENKGTVLSLPMHEIERYFSFLDTLLPSLNNKSFLVSANLPFANVVLNLMWAHSREVNVILSSDQNFDEAPEKEERNNLKMDFGLFFFGNHTAETEGSKYQLLFDSVKFADVNGFRSVWTPERHFNEFGGLFPNPSVLSAALAVSTENIQIRSGSLVAPLHNAIRIAEEWSVVDNLSKGRIGISFASGWQSDDFVFFPERYNDRHHQMIQQFEMVRSLWKGEKLNFTNGLGQQAQIGIFPRPIQRELPIWMTVSRRRETYIDAGKAGANILTHLFWQDFDDLEEKIKLYRCSLKDNGFDPAKGIVTVMVHTYLGENDNEVKNIVSKPLKNYLRTSTELIQVMLKNDGTQNNQNEGDERDAEVLMDELVDIAFNRFYDRAGLLGTVEKARTLVSELEHRGVNEVACLIDFGLTNAQIINGLRFLNELRSCCQPSPNEYPVAVTHCSLEQLDRIEERQYAIRYFRSQDKVLVNGTGAEEVPDVIRSNSVYIDFPQGGKDPIIKMGSCSNEVLSENAFTSTLSSEF